MLQTPAIHHVAERRPRRRRSGRASSPLALVAWAAVAGLLTFGQLRRPAVEAVGAWMPSMSTGVAGSPFAAPFTTRLVAVGPVVVEPVRLPEIVSAPRSTPEPPRSPSRPRVRMATKRPFASLAPPRLASTSPLLMPRLRLPRVLEPRLFALKGLLARPRPGEPAAVRLTAYCLRGFTRRGNAVRTGIIAADPRVFPLGRHVELYAAGRYLGRYLVDDTGRDIKGDRIDIWTPDCDDARRFGRRDGVAALVAAGS